MNASIPADDDKQASHESGSVQAALARTLARGLGLYFSRPVRLFRPTKISGWHSLKGLAQQDGHNLSHKYMFSLIRNQGWLVIPKHFVPPMIINAMLGTALWATYGGVYDHVDTYMGGHPIFSAALSGMAAGAVQAAIAAPAENARLVIEGGSGGRSWTHAWKEVFRGAANPSLHSKLKEHQMEDIRRLRLWMREVGGMAGQGWQGWGWGCAKDMCGFAAFFSIFEITRRCAIEVKATSSMMTSSTTREDSPLRTQAPRVAHALTLVFGGIAAGLAYEYVCVPWDHARKVVHTVRTIYPGGNTSIIEIISRDVKEQGLPSYFEHPIQPHSEAPKRYARLCATLRTLARAGPWGLGFLVWEAYGSGL